MNFVNKYDGINLFKFHKYVKKQVDRDKEMLEKIFEMGVIISLGVILCSCALLDTSDKKVSEISFSVVDVSELPDEIQSMLEEKKKDSFRMAYHTDKTSYIILGYGMQETSGYSIQVNDVYQGENGIWVDTDLIGPEKSERAENTQSYPFVVIKTDKVDQTIRFKS